MLKSIVRDALLVSVTCRAPPVSFPTSHESTVPKASVPASPRARAPGTLSSSQRILLAEKYASISSPVFAWTMSAAPSFLRRSQKSAVRRSCQTIALWIGSPLLRAPTIRLSPLFVVPHPATPGARGPGPPAAPPPTPRPHPPHFAGAVSPPPAPGQSS